MKTAVDFKHLNRGVLITVACAVAAMVTLIIFLSYQLVHLDRLVSSTSRSSQTVQALEDLSLNMVNAETGVRGYVITNDRAYLEPYQDSRGKVPQNLSVLKAEIGINVTGTEYDAMSRLSAERLDQLAAAIVRQETGDVSGKQAAIQSGNGKRSMDELRRTIQSAIDRNARGISDQQRESHDSVRFAIWLAAGVSLLVLFISAAILFYFKRSLDRERALENTKSEFLSLASHQLRTPATNVKQYVGLLLDGYLGDITDKQAKALDVAYRNNELGIRIMNDLLDVAKLDLKRIELHKKTWNVGSIARQLLVDFTDTAAAKSQTLSYKGPDRLMAVVDKEYLKGVVEKLIDNAVRYSRNGTTITVSLAENAESGTFEISVRDRGLGIEKHQLPQLFRKFSRLSNEFSANSEGSGMGLYWVKQVIELHGGAIIVASRQGKGSRFTIRLPLGDASETRTD